MKVHMNEWDKNNVYILVFYFIYTSVEYQRYMLKYTYQTCNYEILQEYNYGIRLFFGFCILQDGFGQISESPQEWW